MYKIKIGKALLGETIETPENFYMELQTFHMTPDDVPDYDPVKKEIWDEAFPVFIGDEGNAWASLDFVLENHKHILEINQNVTYQCVECDSTEILLADPVCEWDVTNQRWQVADKSNAVYFCKTSDEHMNIEVNEIPEQEVSND